MLRIYARLVLLFAALVGIVLLVGSLLPRSFHVEQSITISANTKTVFDQISDLHRWLKWSPWSVSIPKLGAEVKPLADGSVSLRWHDPRGEGELWLTEIEPAHSVRFRMSMGRFKGVQGEISLTEDNPTRVRWTFDGSLPAGPFYGYFQVFFRGGMQQQMLASLNRLKQLCEQK